MAPRPGVHEGLGVEPVDGVGHPVVKVEDVLDGDVGPAPTRTPSYGKQTVLNPDTELFGSDPNPAIMKTKLRYLKKFWKSFFSGVIYKMADSWCIYLFD